MPKNQKEVLEAQTKILTNGYEILKSQIKEIEKIGKSNPLSDEDLENQRACILVTQKRCVSLFTDLVGFLVGKIKTEDDDNFRFYFTHIRTLIEIYSYLQYLTNLDEDDQLVLIVSNQLYTLSKVVRGSTYNKTEIQRLYTEQRKTFLHFFEKFSIDIPEDMDLLTKTKMDKEKFTLVPVDQRLIAAEIKKDCPLTAAIWNIEQTTYEFYRRLSDYVHGNSLMSEAYSKQRFWLISELTIFASAMIELLNSNVVNNSKQNEHKEFLNLIRFETRDFTKVWQSKS